MTSRSAEFVNAPIRLRQCPVTSSPIVHYGTERRPLDGENYRAMIRRMLVEWGWGWRRVATFLGRGEGELRGKYTRGGKHVDIR